jgi:hypothetical protein
LASWLQTDPPHPTLKFNSGWLNAVQIACANLAGLDAIVARGESGFQATAVPVLALEKLLKQLGE